MHTSFPSSFAPISSLTSSPKDKPLNPHLDAQVQIHDHVYYYPSSETLISSDVSEYSWAIPKQYPHIHYLILHASEVPLYQQLGYVIKYNRHNQLNFYYSPQRTISVSNSAPTATTDRIHHSARRTKAEKRVYRALKQHYMKKMSTQGGSSAFFRLQLFRVLLDHYQGKMTYKLFTALHNIRVHPSNSSGDLLCLFATFKPLKKDIHMIQSNQLVKDFLQEKGYGVFLKMVKSYRLDERFRGIEPYIYRYAVNPLVLHQQTPHVILYLTHKHLKLPQTSPMYTQILDSARLYPKRWKELNHLVSVMRQEIQHEVDLLILEASDGITLYHFFNTHQVNLSTTRILLQIMFEIAYTLLCMDTIGLTHNDLHCNNIFLQKTLPIHDSYPLIYVLDETNVILLHEQHYTCRIFDWDHAYHKEAYHKFKQEHSDVATKTPTPKRRHKIMSDIQSVFGFLLEGEDVDRTASFLPPLLVERLTEMIFDYESIETVELVATLQDICSRPITTVSQETLTPLCQTINLVRDNSTLAFDPHYWPGTSLWHNRVFCPDPQVLRRIQDTLLNQGQANTLSLSFRL